MMLARDDDFPISRELSKPKSERPWSEVAKEVIRSESVGLGWYAVHCAGATDGRVIECIKRVGWKWYQPHTRELRPVPKRKLAPSQRSSPFPVMAAVEVPLFPRYPLIHFDPADGRRHDLFALLGVQGILCDGSGTKPQPAPISEAIIQALMAQEVAGVIPSKATIKELVFSVGEHVRIRGGAFFGFDAEVKELPNVPIEELDADDRIKLLVMLFGRATVVELPVSEIEKL